MLLLKKNNKQMWPTLAWLAHLSLAVFYDSSNHDRGVHTCAIYLQQQTPAVRDIYPCLKYCMTWIYALVDKNITHDPPHDPQVM